MSSTTIASAGTAAISSADRRRTRGCTMAFNRSRAARSPNTIAASAGRSSAPPCVEHAAARTRRRSRPARRCPARPPRGPARRSRSRPRRGRPAGAPRSTCPSRFRRSAPPAAPGAALLAPASGGGATGGVGEVVVAGPAGGPAGEAGGVVGRRRCRRGATAGSTRRARSTRASVRGRPPGNGWSGRIRVSVAGP